MSNGGNQNQPQVLVTTPSWEERITKVVLALLLVGGMIYVGRLKSDGKLTPEDSDRITEAIKTYGPLLMSKAPESSDETTVTTVTTKPSVTVPSAPVVGSTVAAVDMNEVIKAIQQGLEIWKQLKPVIDQLTPKPDPKPDPLPEPKPKPDPVIIDPIPNPKPQPKPTPPPGSLALKITDATGQPITSATVPAGRLIMVRVVGTTGSYRWKDTVSNAGVQVGAFSTDLSVNDGFAIVLPKAGEWIELSVVDSTLSQVSMRITANQGAQPPPDDQSNVVPVVPVDPVRPDPPLVSKAKVYMVYDPMFDSPQQATIRGAFSWWNGLKATGNDYGFYTTGTNDEKAKAVIAYATSNQVSPPCLVAVDLATGKPVQAIHSPATLAEVESWLKKIVRQ